MPKGGLRLEVAKGAQAGAAVASDEDVVKDFDPEKFAGLGKMAGDFNVGWGGVGFSGVLIEGEDMRGAGLLSYGFRPGRLPSMDDGFRRGHGSDGSMRHILGRFSIGNGG